VCCGIYLADGALFALSLMAGNILVAMDVVGLWNYDKVRGDFANEAV
jgi:hypothetical protein